MSGSPVTLPRNSTTHMGPTLSILAGTLAIAAVAAAAIAWKLYGYLSYQRGVIASLRQDLVVARRELSFEAERAQRILGASAAPMLTLLADHVERCAGHVEGAFVLERMAGEARQHRWHVEEMDRIFLSSRGISIGRPHPADFAAAALHLAHHLLQVEYQNLEVARHCQIVPHRERQWVAEVMSRLQRIVPGEDGVRLLEYFRDAFKQRREVGHRDLPSWALPVSSEQKDVESTQHERGQASSIEMRRAAEDRQLSDLAFAAGAPWLTMALQCPRTSGVVRATMAWMVTSDIVDEGELQAACSGSRPVPVGPDTLGLFAVAVAALSLEERGEDLSEEAAIALAVTALKGVRPSQHSEPLRKWIDAIQTFCEKPVRYEYFRRMLAFFVGRHAYLAKH